MAIFSSKIPKFPHCDPIAIRLIFEKKFSKVGNTLFFKVVLKNDSYKYRLKWLCEPRISSMNKSPYLRFKVSNLISWRTEGMIRLLNEKFVVAYFRLGCNAEKIEICFDLSVLQRNGINKLKIRKNIRRHNFTKFTHFKKIPWKNYYLFLFLPFRFCVKSISENKKLLFLQFWRLWILIFKKFPHLTM